MTTDRELLNYLHQIIEENFQLRIEVAQLKQFVQWRAEIKPLKEHTPDFCSCDYCFNFNYEKNLLT